MLLHSLQTVHSELYFSLCWISIGFLCLCVFVRQTILSRMQQCGLTHLLSEFYVSLSGNQISSLGMFLKSKYKEILTSGVLKDKYFICHKRRMTKELEFFCFCLSHNFSLFFCFQNFAFKSSLQNC